MNQISKSQSLEVEPLIKTWGQLKIELIQRGIYIPPEILARPDVACGLDLGAPGEEIALTLSENFIVKAVLKPDGEGRVRLQVDDRILKFESEDWQGEVGVIPLPTFLKNQLKERTPVSENICLDGYCLNIFLRALDKGSRLSISEENILATVQSAFQEGAADLVQLNMDYCGDKDRGFHILAPVVQAIKRNFKTFVALKGFPPQEKRTVDLIYASGFDLLNFPLGGFAGPESMKEIIPTHQVHSALEYAVGIFSPGTVWTELVLGTEPLDAVTKQVEFLTERGIVPQIKIQPSSLGGRQNYSKIRKAAEYLQQVAQRARIPLKWLYPNCRCVSPLDAQFFTKDFQSAQLAVQPIYRSRLSKKAFEGFAALRRKLRIRNVSDSYESAGL